MPQSTQEELGKELFDDPLLTVDNMKKLADCMQWSFKFDWPHREGFSCKRIEEHKQEDVNTQSDIANMNEANQRGVQELDSKGLIDTVEKIKNGGPGSL